MRILKIAVVFLVELFAFNGQASAGDGDCDVFPEYEVSPADYFSFPIQCNVSTSPFQASVRKIAIILNGPCDEILQVRNFISNTGLLTHVYLWDRFNVIANLNDNSFDRFVNVSELSLVGFENLRYITSDTFRPLRLLERLFLKQFGFTFLKHADIGLALTGLSGTPLKLIVMDRIHGVLSPGKKLDLNELFQIRNVSIETWVYSNNVVTEYAGFVSEILPDLKYFCMGIAGTADYISYSELVLDLLIRSRNLTDFILYSMTVDITPNPPFLALEGIKIINRSLMLSLMQYPNDACYLGMEFPLTPTLHRYKVSGDLVCYPRGGTACIHRSNRLISASMSNDNMNGVMPIIRQMEVLKDIAFCNMNISVIPIDFLKYLPLLETLTLRQLSLGKFVSTLNSSFFGNRPSLRTVEMTNCGLIKIPKQTFELLPNLCQLNLSANTLSEFDVSLPYNGALSVLDLSQNSLDTLPVSVTECLSSVADTKRPTNDRLSVDLTGNTLSCLCNNIYFVKWFAAVSGDNVIYFPNADSYECILPNGSRALIRRIDVNELANRCQVLQQIHNESDCPCDDITRDQLKRIPLSLEKYYCRNVKSELVSMTGNLPACINIYVTAQFLAPVIVGSVVVIALVVSLILVYRYRHNERLQPIVDCFGIERIIGHALRLLMLKTGGEDQASFSHDIFLHVHQLDSRAEKFIADELSTLRTIVTPINLIGGFFVLEAENECTRRCRWIVPVLTPTSVADARFIRYINRVLFDRPHALVPIVWTPLTADDYHKSTIDELFKLRDPLCWPGDDDSDVVEERRDKFWKTLLARTEQGVSA
jgi:hypothetical protein